jgi:hypothetical protein
MSRRSTFALVVVVSYAALATCGLVFSWPDWAATAIMLGLVAAAGSPVAIPRLDRWLNDDGGV